MKRLASGILYLREKGGTTMRCAIGFVTLALLFSLCSAWAEEAAEWTPLFNGIDLAGWHEVLGGKWHVENGCIIGETGDGRYGWLVTDKMYSDFVLELDFKTEGPGNSGVQFRSHVIKEGPQHDTDRMRGYQGEVSPKRGENTGGVYEEAGGRGWLATPPKELSTVMTEGEWNRYKISAIGDHIVTHLNGVKMVDFHDDKAVRGCIALQVHSGRTPVRVLWKNVRIQDLGYGPGWTPLFNGKDLTGWRSMGNEKWTVEDAAIVGECMSEKYGYLATDKTYKDFVIRIKYRMTGGNSGLFFHTSFDDKGELTGGVQSEIAEPKDSYLDGQLYSGKWLTDISKATYGLVNPNDWNDMHVTCKGNRITTYVNGYQVSDYTDPNPKYTDGVIALQLHSGGQTKTMFKDIFIKEP
jgi:hypothetical protein